MNWIDIASIIFVCVTMNHLGLISAIEDISKMEIPIINCVKCFTFWTVLAYGIVEVNSSLFTIHSSLSLLAISFLASYLAIWLELFEGTIDHLYAKVYEKIYPTPDDNTLAADPDNGNSAGTMPDVQQNNGIPKQPHSP